MDPALTLRDGAQLDLGGHTLVFGFSGGGRVAVLLEGQGAVLQNGTVRCITSLGSCQDLIRVAGRGKHTVRHVNAGAEELFEQAFGIIVVSDLNRLLGNMAIGFQVGFLIQGHKNQLDSNRGGGQGGFSVDGHHNQLANNSCCSVGRIGFAINGNKNVVMGNNVSGHSVGIAVSGEGNTIMRNTALGGPIDLTDSHEDCDKNRWRQNIFETSWAGTTANPACIQ